jgi:hypothetical protein
VTNTFISHYRSHKQCILSQFALQHCYVIPNKPLAGFELGSSDSLADTMCVFEGNFSALGRFAPEEDNAI